MSSVFLDDLTRAGNAVWEHYLARFVDDKAPIPPEFPVWDAVTDPDIERILIKYSQELDWRGWMGWSMAFSTMATVAATVADTPAEFDELQKFAQLLAIHMGQKCPGGHAETLNESMAIIGTLPEYPGPQWISRPMEMDLFRFQVAAHQEWLFLQGSFVPGMELSEDEAEENLSTSSELENELFKDTEFHTLIGLMVLSMHLAAGQLNRHSDRHFQTGSRVLCVQAHGMEDAITHYVVQANMGNMMSALWPLGNPFAGPATLN